MPLLVQDVMKTDVQTIGPKDLTRSGCQAERSGSYSLVLRDVQGRIVHRGSEQTCPPGEQQLSHRFADGLPDKSGRRIILLMKKPISGSNSGTCRPAVGIPIHRSSCPL